MTQSNRKIELELDTEIVNLKGEPLKDGDKKNVTLKDIIVDSILTESGAPDPKKNWKIANKVYNYTEKIYTSDETEIEYLEKIITKSPAQPMVKGQVLEIIEDAKLTALNKGKIPEKVIKAE